MGGLDRTASAFLTVVHALSVLRPGGKSRDGQHKLNVTVHEGKVGRQSQSKYLVTLRVGKEKKETKKRRSDGLIWDYEAEFLHWTPADPLILKLRKAKRCKDKTVAVLSLDVAAAIESVDGLPNRWWYALDRIDKSGRQKEEAFLQVTVTVDGVEGKHASTQDQDRAKPVQETLQPAAPENPETTSPPSAGGDAVAAPSSTTSSAPSQLAKPSTKGKVKLRRERRRSISQDGRTTSSTPSHSISAVGSADKSSTKGDVKANGERCYSDSQDGEATSSKSSHSASNEGTSERSSTKGEVRSRRSSVYQEGEEGTSESSRRTDTSPPSAAGDVEDDKPESSPTTGPTSSPPASSNTPDQTGTSCKGEGDATKDPEGHSSRDKDVEVSPASIDVDNDSGRGKVAAEKPESSRTTGPTSSPPASSNTPDQTGTSCKGEGDATKDPEGHSSRDKDVEVSPVSIDVDSSTGYRDSGRGEAPVNPGFSEKTVPLEKPETSDELKEIIEELEVPQVDTAVDKDSGQGQVADEKPESSPTTGPTSSPPPSSNTPDQAATSGSGEGDVMADPEGHSSRDKDVEVSPVSIDVDSSTGYMDSGRDATEPGSSEKTVPLENPETSAELKEMTEDVELEVPQVDTTVDNDSGQGQAPAETEPPKDTESPDNGTSDADSDRPDTASSPQGGGVALPLTNPPPRHKDADDPTYESLIWSIEDKWEDIMSKKQYADELYTYANTLRSKLEATVPHVLNYPVIKNLAAKVPKCPEYELPDTQGMSLEDLQHIRDTLTKLSLKEEERATYLRRWYIEDLCAVAMREAPQVLETLK